tara:strand:+ start:1744 stop:1917 length:174 start_codon:yes stop_codon:yes gene_type:complete
MINKLTNIERRNIFNLWFTDVRDNNPSQIDNVYNKIKNIDHNNLLIPFEIIDKYKNY